MILMCGYNKKDHGYLNPFQDLISKNFTKTGDIDDEDKYKPVRFEPTDPYDANAGYANIIAKEDGNKELIMFTEAGEYIEEDTIVEFSYDISKPEGWKWIPIKVRYDKTAELRNGQKNYGNPYHVANSNWKTIHNPITKPMIAQGVDIPEFVEEIDGENTESNEDVYYNRVGDERKTKALRDFHNLFVKRKLIMGVSNRGDILIDYAVGKAGDLSKWVSSNLSFVFGVDISKDNIHNSVDGACSRYLNLRRKQKNMPYALFVNGTSALNIRNGDAFSTEKDKQIAKAVFGYGPKDATVLGQGVYEQYDVANSGFHVSSVQFALHYFLKNTTTFHNFMRNVSECTRINGYFIGTCYDGTQIFKLLKNKNEGESLTIMSERRKIFELTKRYAQSGFPDDETSVGYQIDVFQETINKTFMEYLVNFNYLKRVMEDYGFVLISKEDARNMGLPNGSGLFEEMYHFMENEISRNPARKADYKNANIMTSEERQISFLNRYFVFRKVRNVNAYKNAKIANSGIHVAEKNENEQQTKEEENDKIVVIKKSKGKKIKITQPATTQPATTVQEEEVSNENTKNIDIPITDVIKTKPVISNEIIKIKRKKT